MAKSNGGAAYPSTWRDRSDHGRGEVQEWHNSGMTLRDYFAAKAISGMLSALDAAGLNYSKPAMMAEHADSFADAMLAARKQAQ